MRDIFFFFLILGVCVGMYLSQDAGGGPNKPQNKIIAEKIELEPLEYHEEPEIFPSANCYAEENHCSLDKKYVPKAVCVYKKKMGLTNFYGLCSIGLQDCLIRQQKRLNDGSASLDDEIFHNGKHFDCHYYVGHAKSERQAVIWYFKLAGLDAEKENITQPFEIFD